MRCFWNTSTSVLNAFRSTLLKETDAAHAKRLDAIEDAIPPRRLRIVVPERRDAGGPTTEVDAAPE